MASTSQDFKSLLEQQRSISRDAEKHIQWTTPLPVGDPKARFPGFHQRIIQYHAGQQVDPGAMRLPSDLVMHESVTTILKDGTKLYSDIFLPPRFQSLSSNYTNPVPAIIAWYVR